ncbi:DUF308 domain-containing protein [Lacticaseibacillus yichunensis]|uniref:DUF308 domain-containing protein n=1 Tax=Lacticaseibacillus yichunensis TaxID=2486015 RepID=A0ABW4CNS9_9LACO|nr:DUF308 domain-containing protein [Lacticaseibacillus yichunensis]
MQVLIDHLKQWAWLRTLLMALCGVWFVLAPGTVYSTVKWLIIVVLIVMAVPDLATGLRDRRSGMGDAGFVRGVSLLIAALLVWVLLRPILSMMPLLIGIALIAYGLDRVTSAKRNQRYVNVSPLPQILYGILVLLVGIVLVFNPFRSVLLMLQVIGVVLIVMSVLELITVLRMK